MGSFDGFYALLLIYHAWYSTHENCDVSTTQFYDTGKIIKTATILILYFYKHFHIFEHFNHVCM